ncbi:MAG: glycosyltransferase family 2 protein [Clostridia bacterium]|nr:glycosyltransferase family 2 protein [Clostridia bacterium]
MKNENLISIILPAYNSEKTIEVAINSVMAQTYKNFELLIIDNGSKDNTFEICNKFQDEKIKYIKLEEANVSNARNIGIENALGEYITFIDSDDKFDKNFLQIMISKIQKTNSDLITCGFCELYSKKIVLLNKEEVQKIEYTSNSKEYLEILKEKYLFNELWNKLYSTDIIKNNNIKFDTKLDLGEDFLFNIDYLKYSKNFSYINEALYIYTDSKDGLNLKYRENKFEIEYYLTKKLEEYYKLKNWNLDYIYNRYGRIYYNGVLNIYVKNNEQTKKEKDSKLEKFLENNKEDIKFLKDKITERKFNFFINSILLSGKFITKVFVKLVLLKKGE